MLLQEILVTYIMIESNDFVSPFDYCIVILYDAFQTKHTLGIGIYVTSSVFVKSSVHELYKLFFSFYLTTLYCIFEWHPDFVLPTLCQFVIDVSTSSNFYWRHLKVQQLNMPETFWRPGNSRILCFFSVSMHWNLVSKNTFLCEWNRKLFAKIITFWSS